mmetsp:Transcript_36549/g.50932  ORF Transcript_36549/g.50932 Transcript_36549/m.50932 type:complete len:490 (-) Transcript_36549:386-1855(-)
MASLRLHCVVLGFLGCLLLTGRGADVGANWAGVNSFFAHALPSTGPGSRTAYLDHMRESGLRVLRIFLVSNTADYKNSGSQAVEDLETREVGTYDDRILSLVDDLMLEAHERGIKLDIALHDRYSLGCWREDAYVTEYSLPSGCCKCVFAKNQVDRFYTDPEIQAKFDERLVHILQHWNPHFKKSWGDLHEVVASFAPQNEAQGHIWSVDKGWWCRRAQVMKAHMHPSIAVSTGGSVDLEDALYQQLYVCPDIDVVDIHTYSTSACDIKKITEIAATWAVSQGKRVRLQEFGINGTDAEKARQMIPILQVANELGVPFMPWELMHPENNKDFEFWAEGDFWDGFSLQSDAAQKTVSVFSWPELESTSPKLKGDWYFCVVNEECTSGCCSKEWSDDKKYKCTPGGSQCTGNRLADWVFCTQNSDCANGCCSKQWSDDGRYKCTPGGNPSLCGDAVLKVGDACSANGDCASGCCTAGTCSPGAAPAQCNGR